MGQIEPGDIVRMTEPDGTPVKHSHILEEFDVNVVTTFPTFECR